jgi:uncharacterized protein YndB with AHSA1/START domain
VSDGIRVSTRVAVGVDAAFQIFTEEVDAWWRRGPRFRWNPERDGVVRFEPGEGGRFLEVYDEASGDAFEVGRIQVWDPPKRLVFTFRARAFAPGESTEVEVRFEPASASAGAATDVTIEHRGWDALREDHPARHALDGSAFTNMMGVWWADLLTSARQRAAARGKG